MHTSDPLERLRAANPVPPAAVEALRPDPVLLRRVTLGPPSRVRRRGRVLVPVIAVTSLLSGAVGYAVLRDGAPKPQSVACHEEADPESRAEVVAVVDGGPVAACADLWRRGVLGPGDGQAPPLVQCILESGAIGVFPAAAGDDVCRRLTTPGPSTTAPPDLADVNDRFLAFRNAVLTPFLESPCFEPAAATRLVRTELERAGLADWQVRSGEFTAERPCATLSFRPENREVVLSPAPPRR